MVTVCVDGSKTLVSVQQPAHKLWETRWHVMQHLDVSGIIVRVGIVVGTNAQRSKIEVRVRGQETVDGWMKNVRSVRAREFFQSFLFFTFLLCHSNNKNITRIAHLYRTNTARKSTFGCELNYDENLTRASRSNTGTLSCSNAFDRNETQCLADTRCTWDENAPTRGNCMINCHGLSDSNFHCTTSSQGRFLECRENGTSCVDSCLNMHHDQVSCDADSIGCSWNATAGLCMEGCGTKYSNEITCNADKYCMWEDSQCIDDKCVAYDSQDDCNEDDECIWLDSSNECGPNCFANYDNETS